MPDSDADSPGQLFNLDDDPGETKNPYSKRPQIVAKLKTLLEQSKAGGRSAPLR